jgi:D-alanine-D-alanine ligase
MKIEVITTPNGDHKETGFGALIACQSVVSSIEKLGHDVKMSVCETEHNLDDIVEERPDLVILAVKYISIQDGDDIWLSEYFEKNEVNYSGSSREILKFDSNKILAKTHLKEKGIRTAEYFTAIPGQFEAKELLPIMFPLFLKPSDAANGNGVDDSSFVTNFTEFESKVLSLYDDFDTPVLAEEYLDGQEFTVAVLKNLQGNLIVSTVEIVPAISTNGLRILGEKAKKDDSEELIITADSELGDRVQKLAVDAFLGLGARDFGRIDIKTNKRGDCFFMEANLVPGMTSKSSYFPKACEIQHGLTYDSVIELIVANGLDRVPAAGLLRSMGGIH